jgi:hypothetical protein
MALEPIGDISDVSLSEIEQTAITWETATDWDSAVDEAMVVHEASQTGYPLPAGGGTITMGYPTDSIAGHTVSAMWTHMESSGSTVNDVSGNGNDGTTEGSPNMTATGPYGEAAMGCDNTDDGANVPRNSQTYPASENSTVITTFATTAAVTNDDRTYTGQGTNSFNGAYFAGGQNTDGKYSLVYIVNGNSYQHRYDSATSVDDGALHAAAGRYDYSAGDTFLHVDGTQENSDTGGPQNGDLDVDDGSTTFGLGHRHGDESGWWDGRMSFTIVVRGLLTQAEANAWTQLTNGHLESATKSFGSTVQPNLSNLSYSLNGESIDLDVIGSPGTASEEVVTQTLDGASSYSLTWSSGHTDFRVRPTLSVSSPSGTPPTFGAATLAP